MNTRTIIRTAALAALAATSAGVAQAQSSDALLNKLVQKGVLTQQEAEDLRKETDAGFDKAYRARTGLPDWVTQLKFYGDLRGRYDRLWFDNDDAGGPNATRDRLRYRLRVGTTVSLKDNLELGFRLISGEPDSATAGTLSQGGNPVSGNQTFRDNGSKKFIYIDLAYGKWTPVKNDDWNVSLSIGKIENPFITSDLVFDPDYTPEGGAVTLAYKLDEMHTFRVIAGGFAIDENNQGITDDPFLLGGQVRWDAKWSKRLESSLGFGAFKLTDAPNLVNGSVPNIDVGNTRSAGGVLLYDYTPLVADASVTYSFDVGTIFPGPMPLRFAGTFLHNPSAPSRNNGFELGVVAGRSGKKRSWELSYRYKYLEGDATYEEFPDDDFGAYYAAIPGGYGRGAGYNAGTNIRGHVVKASYSPYDAITLSLTYFGTELISNPDSSNKEKDSGTGRVFMDATWKF